MAIDKKQFDSKFNELCKNEKKEKERKKELFNKNIKSHVVYMDEDGNISKKDSSKIKDIEKENVKNLYIAKTVKQKKHRFDSSEIGILLLVIILLLCCLYYWFNYLGIV